MYEAMHLLSGFLLAILGHLVVAMNETGANLSLDGMANSWAST
jgi:hypothetical protein